MLRQLRQTITARVTDAAARVAPRLPATMIDQWTSVLARCGAHLPVIGRQVAENMRALGVYSPQAFHGYFAELGRHFAGALQTLRSADPTLVTGVSAEFAALVEQRVELDESVARLHKAAALNQGVILAGPHVSNYLLFLGRLNRELPLTVYLRHSKDARRQELKQRWYQASGVGWVSEPADAGGTLGRMGRLAAALNEGRIVYITPDLPQKRHDGTPVRFFGREIYLPAGPAMLAVRTWAPFFVLVAERRGARQRLVVRGPYEPPPLERGRDARRVAIRQHLQWFATCFEEFVRAQPALWYLWGDKRWTRVLRGDARYVRPLRADEPVAEAAGMVEAG